MATKQNKLVVVAGPTASGKSRVAIQLALSLETEIFSADSRQVYSEMRIGTARPSDEEIGMVRHHLIGHKSIHEPYNAGIFEKELIGCLSTFYRNHEMAILCGGTGLYIQAALEGLDDMPMVPMKIQSEIQSLYRQNGITSLQKALKKADPEYYASVDLKNPHRLMRALGVITASGKKFSSYHQSNPAKRDFLPIRICLERPRDELYRRIEDRVDEMLQLGLLEEVKALYPFRHLKSLQTVGYRELFEHLDGNISLDDAVDLIKRNSRRYAKRQLTWFRRDDRWMYFHPDDFDGMSKLIRQAGV